MRHIPESIIETLRNLAGSLGKDTLAKSDLRGVIAVSSVRYHFGSLGAALDAAGLRRRDGTEHLRNRGPTLTNEDLFTSIAAVEAETGREPSYSEYQAHGKYSTQPFKRLGRWGDVLALYRRWRREGKQPGLSRQALAADTYPPGAERTKRSTGPPATVRNARADLYGEPINFRGLRHAPTNEQGIVYLFGMVSRELGFSVERLRQAFPDCEAMYEHDRKKGLWARARIEFEFKSSAFLEHLHDPTECDLIVCWEHDWTDCPIRVIELRSEIRKLPNT